MFRWSYPLAVLLVVGVVGCDGKKGLPGAGCLLNSDCNTGLSCTDMRCHVMCKEAIDCLLGQLCAGPPDAGVCLLPDEQECGLNSDCPDWLFCAIDLTCRNQCENEHDCPTSTQKCVPSVNDVNIKVCAEPPDLEEDMLKPAPTPDGGASPDGGSSADAAADAGDASGSDAAADAAVESVPDAGQSSDAGQSGDGGGLVVPEKEPNEDRDNASPYTPGTTVTASIGSTADIDFYQTTVPADHLAGGYYQASITDVGEEGAMRAVVYTMSDNNIVHQVTNTTNGGSLFFYWAAAPAQTYRIALSKGGNFVAPYNYTLKIQYTKVDDAFEPNDDRDGWKLIDRGTPVTAYLFAGFKTNEIDPNDYPDWFAIDLDAGMTTVAIDNRITNWRPQFDMIDSLGNTLSVAHVLGSTAGASPRHTFMVTIPGRYRASILPYGNASTGAEHGNGMTVPENFRNPYTLTISQ